MKHLILALVAATGATLPALADSVDVPPYLFTGRVTDAEHAAFDANKTATIVAYSAGGEKLAYATTFYKADTLDNYNLRIPVATEAASGRAVKGDTLVLKVTDDKGRTWAGVVPVADSVVGAAGEVKRLNIVLAASSNKWGIDDELFGYLEYLWEMSDYWVEGEDFDPTRDYDGDGISTIQEAYAGTNPFDPQSGLKITAYAHDEATGETVTFTAQPSRAYVLEGTDDLEKGDWKVLSFSTDSAGSAAQQSALALPSSASAATPTVYLRPVASPARFFRVRCE